MLKLISFPADPHTHNSSPFCLKLETYLRLSGTPFEPVAESMPNKGPKGKLPFIVEDDGRKIADSFFIIEHLKEKDGDKLDAKLTAEQRALGVAITRLFETDLLFALVYFRWVDPAGWKVTRERMLGNMPLPLKLFVPRMIQKKVRGVLWGQGLGRHTRDEIARIGKIDIDAISELLGDQQYFLGGKPTTVDATAYGFLKNMVDDPTPSPLNEYARTKKNLVQYVARMDDVVFSEERASDTAKARPAKKVARRK